MPGADPVADELVPGLVALRRDLHAHPELAFEERRTAGVVAAAAVTGDALFVPQGAPIGWEAAIAWRSSTCAKASQLEATTEPSHVTATASH